MSITHRQKILPRFAALGDWQEVRREVDDNLARIAMDVRGEVHYSGTVEIASRPTTHRPHNGTHHCRPS